MPNIGVWLVAALVAAILSLVPGRFSKVETTAATLSLFLDAWFPRVWSEVEPE